MVKNKMPICSDCKRWKGFSGCILKSAYQGRYKPVLECEKFIEKERVK